MPGGNSCSDCSGNGSRRVRLWCRQNAGYQSSGRRPKSRTGVDVERAEHSVAVPEEAEQNFVQSLERRLYEESGFEKGSELRIRYRFVQFDPGNQFARWFWGGLGNTGEGSLSIEAKFVDSSGAEIATIQAQGSINSGFFGGSFELAIDKAAQEIAEYTVADYGANPSRR